MNADFCGGVQRAGAGDFLFRNDYGRLHRLLRLHAHVSQLAETDAVYRAVGRVSDGDLEFHERKERQRLLFAHPVTRGEIWLGKLLGLFASMLTANLIGFGLGGFVIAVKAGTADALRYPLFVGLRCC